MLDRLGKIYPNGVNALERFSAEIRLGEIVAIIGGSGCGKSTLLRAVAGLDRATSGAVTLDDIAIAAPHAKIGIIFQEPRLLPWLSVADNIGFGLSELPAQCPPRESRACAGAGRSRRQGRCLAARTVRRAGAAGGDRARAGAAAGSAAAGRAVLRARCVHAAGSAGSSARSLGRYAADAGAGHARCRRGRGAGRPRAGDAAAAGPAVRGNQDQSGAAARPQFAAVRQFQAPRADGAGPLARPQSCPTPIRKSTAGEAMWW